MPGAPAPTGNEDDGGKGVMSFDRQALQATLADALRDAETAAAAEPTLPDDAAPSAGSRPAAAPLGVPGGILGLATGAATMAGGASSPGRRAQAQPAPGRPAGTPQAARPNPAAVPGRAPAPEQNPAPAAAPRPAPGLGAAAIPAPAPGGRPAAAPGPKPAPGPAAATRPTILGSGLSGISPSRPLAAPLQPGSTMPGSTIPGALGARRLTNGFSPAPTLTDDEPAAEPATIPLRRPDRRQAGTDSAPAPARAPVARIPTPVTAWRPADDDILPKTTTKRRGWRRG